MFYVRAYVSSPPYSAGVFDPCLYAAPLELLLCWFLSPWGWGPSAEVLPELITVAGARPWGICSWERGDSFPKCLWVLSLAALLHRC